MWTYLVLFTSICVLLIVFARRAWLFFKKKRGGEEESKEKEESPKKEEVEVKSSRAEKNQAEMFYQKGVNLLKTGKEDDSIKMFVQALTADKNHFETLNKLAVLYLQKQMYSASAALFEQLAETTEDATHYSHLGFALYQGGEFEGARDAYQKAIDLDDSRPARFISLAQVYRGMGRPQLAVLATNKALEAEAENPEFLLLLTDLLIEMKDFDGAHKVVSRVFDVDPKNEDAAKALKDIETGKNSQEK